MDRPFLHLPSAEGNIFINLEQIVRVSDMTETDLTIHTTDGHKHVFHGEEAVTKIIRFLMEYAVDLEGRPFILGRSGDDDKEEAAKAKSASES